MHYSDNPFSVRVDFFKPSGKWCTTEAIMFDRYRAIEVGQSKEDYEDIQDTFKRCLREQLNGRLSGMVAVCLEPYHEHAYPLMVRDWNKNNG